MEGCNIHVQISRVTSNPRLKGKNYNASKKQLKSLILPSHESKFIRIVFVNDYFSKIIVNCNIDYIKKVFSIVIVKLEVIVIVFDYISKYSAPCLTMDTIRALLNHS